jgi:hypothetical protein
VEVLERSDAIRCYACTYDHASGQCSEFRRSVIFLLGTGGLKKRQGEITNRFRHGRFCQGRGLEVKRA